METKEHEGFLENTEKPAGQDAAAAAATQVNLVSCGHFIMRSADVCLKIMYPCR